VLHPHFSAATHAKSRAFRGLRLVVLLQVHLLLRPKPLLLLLHL
jgi:hypothetical protein